MATEESRFERLDELARFRRVLLLQGPNGPFFYHLAQRLQARGADVFKVNFNAGDAFFYRERVAIRFRDSMQVWPDHLRAIIESKAIQAIALFGQHRAIHRDAVRVAREMGIKVFVFEEGYARPWWITLEEGGVNEASALLGAEPVELPELARIKRPATFRGAFSRMAFYSFVYVMCGLLGKKHYPHYIHHRPFSARDAFYWMRSAYRKIHYRFSEKKLIGALGDLYGPDFYLVPLQIGTDSQIVFASDWNSNEEFIEATIRSFSVHANQDDCLVFKHHPLERGHTDYGPAIRQFGALYDVAERVHYIHGGHVPTLLRRAKGVVTVNSTVGLQALYHGAPVCATGIAFYASSALVRCGDLDAFWKAPAAPDRVLFTRFYRYMMHRTQINASFYVPESVRLFRPRASLRSIALRVSGAIAALLLFPSNDTMAKAQQVAVWLASSL